MFFVLGFVLLFMGFFMFFMPEEVWDMTEAWKSDSDAEPSEMYIRMTKIYGAFLFAVGIFSLVCIFIF